MSCAFNEEYAGIPPNQIYPKYVHYNSAKSKHRFQSQIDPTISICCLRCHNFKQKTFRFCSNKFVNQTLFCEICCPKKISVVESFYSRESAFRRSCSTASANLFKADQKSSSGMVNAFGEFSRNMTDHKQNKEHSWSRIEGNIARHKFALSNSVYWC